MDLSPNCSAEELWNWISSEMITMMNENSTFEMWKSKGLDVDIEEAKKERRRLTTVHTIKFKLIKGFYCTRRQELLPIARRQPELFDILEEIINKEAEELLLGDDGEHSKS